MSVTANTFPHLFAAAGRYEIVARAIAYTAVAHQSIGHKRPYTGENYELHEYAVAEIIAQYSDDPDAIAAGCTHDVPEDLRAAGYTIPRLAMDLNPRTAGFVGEVTNEFTRERYPNMSRQERKAKEREKLVLISPNGKLIKLGDIINNTGNLLAHDPAFAKVYFAEKAALLPDLRVPGSEAHQILFEQAMRQVARGSVPTPRFQPGRERG